MAKYKAWVRKNMFLEGSDYELLKRLTNGIKKARLEELKL